jgi:hypothetical protein
MAHLGIEGCFSIQASSLPADLMERTARRMLGTMTAAMKMTPSDRDFTDVPPFTV